MTGRKLLLTMMTMVLFTFVEGAAPEEKEKTIATSAKVKKAQVKGGEIAYIVRGKGKPLVMLNGFKGAMGTWDPALLERLEKKYQLIILDRRGIGESSGLGGSPFTVATMAEDVLALINTLGLKKVNLLGWSMGARVGQYLAIRNGDLIEKLILCAPNPGGKYRVTASWKVAQSVHSPTLTLEQMLDMQFPQTALGKASELAYKTRIFQAIKDGTAPDDLTISNETIKAEADALEQWNKSDDNYENLSKIKVPTLLCGGKEDLIDPPENVRLIANRISFAWTSYFEGGHAFLFQDYDRFADLVELFID